MILSFLLWLAPGPACAGALGEFADVHRAALSAPSLPGPASDPRLEELSDPALTQVSREFGPSRIPLDRLPIRVARVNAAKRVWSSYWFPLGDRSVFESAPGSAGSPLEKYDLFRTELRRAPSLAVARERDAFSAGLSPWEGLCDAWSIAAILYPEPSVTRELKLKDNKTLLRFSPGDQKALLLKSFQGLASTALRIYGQRFDGGPQHVVNGQSFGWIQPDLFPDQFHRFLEVALFERRQAFVMDHDPSEAVWSEPVDGANYEILPVAGRFDQVFVRAYLYPAKQRRKEELDVVGKNEHIREYNYILGGSVDLDRTLRVEYGIWLSRDFVSASADYRNDAELLKQVRVDSRRSHPDFVYLVPESARAQRAPGNPEIEPLLVDSILSPSR